MTEEKNSMVSHFAFKVAAVEGLNAGVPSAVAADNVHPSAVAADNVAGGGSSWRHYGGRQSEEEDNRVG